MFNKVRVDCYLHIFKPIKINKDYTEITIDEKGFATKIHSIPAFSSYITSHARVYLLENVLKYQQKSVTYMDTDCVALEKEVIINDSLVLGAFKKEKELLTEIFGNKNYTEMVIDNNGEKEFKRKIKGIPKKALKLDGTYNIVTRLLNEKDIYEFNNIVKTKRAIRQNKDAGVWEETTRQLKAVYDKRTILKNGKTKPLVLTE